MQFKDVIGQTEIKQHLINEVKQDRISHAQMFLGKAGYGTLPLALAFIQYLFCENRNDFDSCGACPSCNKVGKLQHPDVHFTFPTVQAISKTSDSLYKEWREHILNSAYFNLEDWVNKIDVKGRSAIISTDESQNIIKKLALKSFEGREKVLVSNIRSFSHNISHKLYGAITKKESIFKSKIVFVSSSNLAR